jgi:DNA polymerase elongation subunit (family B)
VEHNIRDRLPAAMRGFTMETVMRRSLVGYQRDVAVPMIRVFPPAVRGATNRIAQAFQAELRDGGVRVNETQIDACTRFSLDSGIRCGNWLEVALPAGISSCAAEGSVIDDEEKGEETPAHRHQQQRVPKSSSSNCTVELEGTWDRVAGQVTTCGGVPVQVHAFSKASHWGTLPPLRTLCLSINRYPTSIPAHEWAGAEDCPDPIRAISIINTVEDGSPGMHSKRRIVMLNAEGLPPHLKASGGAPFGPFATRVYPSEQKLLTAFHKLVLAEDPSLLTGFEVGESLRVLLARAEALKIRGFGQFARRKGVDVAIKTMQMYRCVGLHG